MCAQCHEIEATIERYRKLLRGLDPLTTQRVGGYIRELERRKDAVHESTSVAANPTPQYRTLRKAISHDHFPGED